MRSQGIKVIKHSQLLVVHSQEKARGAWLISTMSDYTSFNAPVLIRQQLEAGAIGCRIHSRIVENVADRATSLQGFDISRPRSIPVVQLGYVGVQSLLDGGRRSEWKETIYVVAWVVVRQIAEENWSKI